MGRGEDLSVSEHTTRLGPMDIADQGPDGDDRRESEPSHEDRQPSTIRREVTADHLAPDHVEPCF
jgi:hypothetical protein